MYLGVKMMVGSYWFCHPALMATRMMRLLRRKVAAEEAKVEKEDKNIFANLGC